MRYWIIRGKLPEGMSLNEETGEFEGAPKETCIVDVDVAMHDGVGETHSSWKFEMPGKAAE